MALYRVHAQAPIRTGFCRSQFSIKANTPGEARTTAMSLMAAHAEKAHGLDVHPMHVEITDVALLPGEDK